MIDTTVLAKGPISKLVPTRRQQFWMIRKYHHSAVTQAPRGIMSQCHGAPAPGQLSDPPFARITQILNGQFDILDSEFAVTGVDGKIDESWPTDCG
jgi:hypothetical protein